MITRLLGNSSALLLLALFGCSNASGGGGTAADTSDAASDSSARAETSGDDTAAGEGTSDDTGFYAFMAVHLDPGTPAVGIDGPAHERAERYFPTLAELVETADEDNHELTIMFSAQWASYVSDPACAVPDDGDSDGGYAYGGSERDSCLALVRAWEANGHELAMHHHSEDAPATWDGFSNGPDRPRRLGDLGDRMNYVNAIPQSGSVISGTSEEFPAGGGGFRFTAARGPTPYENADERGDLASVPCAWSEDSHDVWRFRMRSFTNLGVQGTVTNEELPAALADLESSPNGPYTLGFVTHAKNVDDTRLSNYADLFSALSGTGIRLERLQDVGGYYGWTDDDPANAGAEHQCPPDEDL